MLDLASASYSTRLPIPLRKEQFFFGVLRVSETWGRYPPHQKKSLWSDSLDEFFSSSRDDGSSEVVATVRLKRTQPICSLSSFDRAFSPIQNFRTYGGFRGRSFSMPVLLMRSFFQTSFQGLLLSLSRLGSFFEVEPRGPPLDEPLN